MMKCQLCIYYLWLVHTDPVFGSPNIKRDRGWRKLVSRHQQKAMIVEPVIHPFCAAAIVFWWCHNNIWVQRVNEAKCQHGCRVKRVSAECSASYFIHCLCYRPTTSRRSHPCSKCVTWCRPQALSYLTAGHISRVPWSWKILEKLVVMESHGIIEILKKVLEKSWNFRKTKKKKEMRNFCNKRGWWGRQ